MKSVEVCVKSVGVYVKGSEYDEWRGLCEEWRGLCEECRGLCEG